MRSFGARVCPGLTSRWSCGRNPYQVQGLGSYRGPEPSQPATRGRSRRFKPNSHVIQLPVPSARGGGAVLTVGSSVCCSRRRRWATGVRTSRTKPTGRRCSRPPKGCSLCCRSRFRPLALSKNFLELDLIKPPVVSLNPSPSAPPLFVSAASARHRPAPVPGSVPDRAFILEPLPSVPMFTFDNFLLPVRW